MWYLGKPSDQEQWGHMEDAECRRDRLNHGFRIKTQNSVNPTSGNYFFLIYIPHFRFLIACFPFSFPNLWFHCIINNSNNYAVFIEIVLYDLINIFIT